MDRRANVLLLCIKGLNNSEIATELDMDRGTVKSDLDLMIDDQVDWTTNLALIGWMKKVEEIYIETNTSIADIGELQTKLKEEIDDEKFTWDTNPFKPDTQTEDYLKFEDIKRKAYGSFTTRITHYSEYAHLENAKTKAKELLIGLTTHIPLFAATQRLAIYYHQNEQKKQDIQALPQPNIIKKN